MKIDKYVLSPILVPIYAFLEMGERHMAHAIKKIKDNGLNEKMARAATARARSFAWTKNIGRTPDFHEGVA